MDGDQLRLIQEAEEESARADADSALRYWSTVDNPDARELLLRLYGVSQEAAPASFVNSGNAMEAALLCPPALVPVFPFDSERELLRTYGTTAQELADLASEGIVLPISQPATRYERLVHLHPIIAMGPKDYFLRAAYFYAIVFDGSVDIERHDSLPLAPSVGRLYDNARTSKKLRIVSADAGDQLREPYDQGALGRRPEKARRVMENIAYRYASVAVFTGVDVVEYLLDSLPPEESLVVLLHLHVAFDHYLTMGLLSTMHDDLGYYLRDQYSTSRSGSRWVTNALQRWVHPLIHNQTVTLISSPTVDEIVAARDHGVSLNLPRLTDLQDVTSFKAALQTKLAEIDDTLRVISRRRNVTKKTLTIAAFALAAMSKLSGPESIFAAAAALIIPGKVVDVIADEVEKRVSRVGALRTLDYIHAIWGHAPLRGGFGRIQHTTAGG